MEKKKMIITMNLPYLKANDEESLYELREHLVFDLWSLWYRIVMNNSDACEYEKYTQISIVPNKDERDTISFGLFRRKTLESSMGNIIPFIPELKEDGDFVVDLFYDGDYIDRRVFTNPKDYFRIELDYHKYWNSEDDNSVEGSLKVLKEVFGEKFAKVVFTT